MLSPEIWNLKSPEHNFSFVTGYKETENKISSTIINHYFNHSVTVVLPDTVLVPEDLNTALTNDSTYYKIRDYTVHKFLDSQFIESFVKSGQLTALSVSTRIDTDDCVCITPTGHLILDLGKETYQSLGLEASQSLFSTERYVVKIDLNNPNFMPGKKSYDRALKCLSEFVPLKMDFILTWEPPARELGKDSFLVCPSSVAAFISSQGFQVSECSPTVNMTRQYNVRLPSLCDTEPSELLEWLGSVALGVDMNREDAEGAYLSLYRGPLGADAESQVAVLTYQGLFTTNQILHFYSVFRSYVERRGGKTWAALHVNGFADSPVSWGLREHTFSSDGDNNYTLLLQSDGVYHLETCTTAPRKLR